MNTNKETDKKVNPYLKNGIGCYVDSARGIYAIDAIADFAESHGFVINDEDPHNPLPESLSDYEFANELEDEIDDYMNANFAVSYAYWGRSEQGDWGLWPCLESARDDVEFISSRENEYPASDYAGEWLHVNDHGNVTLYVRENGQDSQIWSLV